MLKRNITYKNFDDEEITETFYFNLSRTELMELEASYEGGLKANLEKIIETNDAKTLIAEFQKIILMAYGQKSADGKRFVKNDQLREEFQQTAAYDALFMELATNANVAADFVNGILPSGMSEQIKTVPLAPVPQVPSGPPEGSM